MSSEHPSHLRQPAVISPLHHRNIPHTHSETNKSGCLPDPSTAVKYTVPPTEKIKSLNFENGTLQFVVTAPSCSDAGACELHEESCLMHGGQVCMNAVGNQKKTGFVTFHVKKGLSTAASQSWSHDISCCRICEAGQYADADGKCSGCGPYRQPTLDRASCETEMFSLILTLSVTFLVALLGIAHKVVRGPPLWLKLLEHGVICSTRKSRQQVRACFCSCSCLQSYYFVCRCSHPEHHAENKQGMHGWEFKAYQQPLEICCKSCAAVHPFHSVLVQHSFGHPAAPQDTGHCISSSTHRLRPHSLLPQSAPCLLNSTAPPVVIRAPTRSNQDDADNQSDTNQSDAKPVLFGDRNLLPGCCP